jgi:predicted secreted protein
MRKKALVFSIILFTIAGSGLWAGDTASFVDLGFSPDGKIYMFAQYGVEAKTLRPWADLFVVDVARNVFVPGGRLNYVYDRSVIPGQDGSGAFYRLLARNASLVEMHNIDFLNQGQPLYISPDNGTALQSGQALEFRDFIEGSSYRVTLIQYTEGAGANLKTSFYASVERTRANGVKKSYIVGTPDIKRPLITSYRIVQVLTGPRDGPAVPKTDSLIFIIETKRPSSNGSELRYMIEALSLN